MKIWNGNPNDCSYFKLLLKVGRHRPPHSVPLRNVCPLVLHIQGCCDQILRENLSVWWISTFGQELNLLDSGVEQVLGEGTPRSQWRSQRLRLGHGTWLCCCKSLESNGNFLETVTVPCLAAPGFQEFSTRELMRHSAENTSLQGCLGPRCLGTDGYSQDGWIALTNMLRAPRGNGNCLSLWKWWCKCGERACSLAGKSHRETGQVTHLVETAFPSLHLAGSSL